MKVPSNIWELYYTLEAISISQSPNKQALKDWILTKIDIDKTIIGELNEINLELDGLSKITSNELAPNLDYSNLNFTNTVDQEKVTKYVKTYYKFLNLTSEVSRRITILTDLLNILHIDKYTSDILKQASRLDSL